MTISDEWWQTLISSVIQHKKISRESPKFRLSFRYSFIEAKWLLPILQNRRAKGLTRLKNLVCLNYNKKFFGLKFKLLGKNWMQSNFGFWKLMHLGQNKNMSRGWNLPKIQIFKIWFDTLIPLIFLMKTHPLLQFYSWNGWICRYLLFTPSQAPSSTVWQNWKKSLSFHEWVPKGQPNFGWLAWKLFWLNYSTVCFVRQIKISIRGHFLGETRWSRRYVLILHFKN